MPAGTCEIPECPKPVDTRGWCRGHYRRWQRYGDPLGRPVRPSAEDRFWLKVNKASPVPTYAPHLGPCWIWNDDPDDYGRFWLDGRAQMAHRVAYRWLVEQIPDDLDIDHLCRVHGCVNPAHLEPVTVQINLLRGETHAASNALKTHCPAEHEYTEANTYVEPDGGRQCKTCSRERQQQRWELARKGLGLPGERTHCPRKHAYDEANTYVSPSGTRHCRTCKLDRQRAARAAA